MKHIKYKLHKSLVVLTFFLLFFNCKTPGIKFESKPNFKFSEVYQQYFVGGQPGNAGFNVFMILENPTIAKPDSLYFQERVASVEIRDQQWIARFKTINRKEVNLSQNQETDINEHVKKMDNFPFNLLDNQAVLLYNHNNTSYYYKIVNIKSKEVIYFP